MNRVKICLCLVLLLCTFQVQAVTWVQGKVVSVSDGDTITVLDDKKKSYRIRLDEIDAPESAQAFGQVAKKKLSDAIYLKPVSVQISGQDNYKRIIGTVWLDRTNINLYMVQNGLAWAYDKYVKHDNTPPLNKPPKPLRLVYGQIRIQYHLGSGLTITNIFKSLPDRVKTVWEAFLFLNQFSNSFLLELLPFFAQFITVLHLDKEGLQLGLISIIS